MGFYSLFKTLQQNHLTYLSAQQRLTTKDGKAYYKEK